MLKSFLSLVCRYCKLAHKYLSKSGALISPLAVIMQSPIPFCPELNYHHKKLIKPLKSRIIAALGNFGIFIWVNGAEIPVHNQKALSCACRVTSSVTPFHESLL